MKNENCVVCGMFECEKDSNKCSSCNAFIKHSLKQNKDNYTYRDWVFEGINENKKNYERKNNN